MHKKQNYRVCANNPVQKKKCNILSLLQQTAMFDFKKTSEFPWEFGRFSIAAKHISQSNQLRLEILTAPW